MGKILIIVAILLLLAGGYFYYQSTQNRESGVSVTEPKENEPTEPTPTKVEVKKDAFTIEILNGSGIAGEAGRAQELLESADFKIDSTGNAENYDFEETVIQAGSDVDEAWIELLRDELGKQYTVKSGVTKLDETASDADVVVIVGSFDEKGESMVVEEEATPTPEESEDTTPTPSPTGPTKTPTPSPTGT